jgi:hypothetical protein
MNPKIKSLLIGVLAGALLGAAIGWVVADGSEERGAGGERMGVAALGPGDYFKLGISILTLAREFGQMMKRV